MRNLGTAGTITTEVTQDIVTDTVDMAITDAITAENTMTITATTVTTAVDTMAADTDLIMVDIVTTATMGDIIIDTGTGIGAADTTEIEVGVMNGSGDGIDITESTTIEEATESTTNTTDTTAVASIMEDAMEATMEMNIMAVTDITGDMEEDIMEVITAVTVIMDTEKHIVGITVDMDIVEVTIDRGAFQVLVK